MTLGIYIQVPFCQTKCTYCNFHTGVVARERYQPYAEAVCREIASAAFSPDISSLPVDSIYFGGGTPSLLEPASLAQILESLNRRFSLISPEVTLEADPETIAPENSAGWLAAGFNRISLGSQSFSDIELRAAGRMHRHEDILTAAKILRASGFANISMDLIAGLAHQTRETWENSVSELLGLRPQHISIYMLEIDEGSRLGRESLSGGARYSAQEIPPDDDTAAFYESACLRLSAAGYEHYEISNWSLAGFASRHNCKYWRREPYFGFGAGAHSFDGVTRWANVHDAGNYVSAIEHEKSPREQIAQVTRAQALDEELFLGLRQLAGVDLARIEREYQVDLRRRVDALAAQGLVEFDGSRLRLAPGRLTVSNEVFVELMA